MKGNANISFIIPAYNASNTLAEAVDSIFNGNFEDGDEVIIVNDVSSDDTCAIAERLAKKHAPSISIITNRENKGCAASRNVGVTAAKNGLIFNLDADNILAPGNIYKLKESLIKECADVAAFGEYRFFKTSPESISHRWVCKSGIFTLADLLCGIINPGPGGNYLYRKATWQNVGGYWEFGRGFYEAHESWAFSFKLLMNQAKFIVVPDTFYLHRYSHRSLSVREHDKTESDKLIKIVAPLVDDRSKKFLSNDHDWVNDIEYHPLYLKDGTRGQDSAVMFDSKIKQMIYWFKRMIRNIILRIWPSYKKIT